MAQTYEVGVRVEMISKSFFILREKQRNDVSEIFTSEDMKNMSLVSRM